MIVEECERKIKAVDSSARGSFAKCNGRADREVVGRVKEEFFTSRWVLRVVENQNVIMKVWRLQNRSLRQDWRKKEASFLKGKFARTSATCRKKPLEGGGLQLANSDAAVRTRGIG